MSLLGGIVVAWNNYFYLHCIAVGFEAGSFSERVKIAVCVKSIFLSFQELSVIKVLLFNVCFSHSYHTEIFAAIHMDILRDIVTMHSCTCPATTGIWYLQRFVFGVKCYRLLVHQLFFLL